MALQLKQILTSKAPIKVVSLILGYSLWTILSQSQHTTMWTEVPVCFYQKTDGHCVTAPESIKVALRAKKSHLQTIDFNTLAVHVNASKLKEGDNQLLLNGSHLLLPDAIKLVHYNPANFLITVGKQNAMPITKSTSQTPTPIASQTI